MKKMNNKLKEIDWKNHIYHIFDDTINIKNLKPNKIKMKRKFIQKYTILNILRPKTLALQQLIV